MRKRIQKSYAILALLDGFQKLHLDCIVNTLHLMFVCLFIFFSGFMKASVVYAVALRTHVCNI